MFLRQVGSNELLPRRINTAGCLKACLHSDNCLDIDHYYGDRGDEPESRLWETIQHGIVGRNQVNAPS